MDPVFVLVVAVIWVGVGVAAATMGLGRRGYRDPHWLVLAVVLGPVALVALDGSPEADSALGTASALLGDNRGRFVLTCVVSREVAEGEDPVALDSARTMLEERGRLLGCDADVLIVSGQPADALVSAAQECDADVIVVGRRGRGVSARLLGSVASELARHSPRPVLLTPSDPGRRPSTP